MTDRRDLEGIWARFDAGETREAPAQVLAMLHAADESSVAADCAAVLIDMGWRIMSSDLVSTGVHVHEKLRMATGAETPASVYYNLANGWNHLGNLEIPQPNWAERAESRFFQNAKACAREAIRTAESDGSGVPIEYLVNYANTLDSHGRGLEAIEAYDQALAIDPDFGMALCNKAISIQCFAHLATAYRDALYIWAYQMLQRGLQDPRIEKSGGPGARVAFEQRAAIIEEHAPNPALLRHSLAHPPADLGGVSGFERHYVELCADAHLFLNVHIHDATCAAAILDSMFFRLARPEDKGRYLTLAQAMNQIVEDYCTARYLWVLAQSPGRDMDSISGRTRQPRVGRTEAGLRHGTMKASFRVAYDILDKVAGFINDYLGLGLSGHSVSFTSTGLWHSGRGRGSTRLNPVVEKAMGPGLAGLYDIFLDFQPNAVTGQAYYGELRNARNALTHRRLLVAVGDQRQTPPSGSEIHVAGLERLTRTMLFLSRCAVIYLILFVDWREPSQRGTA